ncbi:M15 family metallopeptidase [Nocardioides sp.]|uniref:M15 family metallopeptidase n=1 Tax=Nocardioides sp. TaxID=35761 RepID=UPI003566ACB8
MTILLSDPRVSAVPLHDDGEPLVALPALLHSACPGSAPLVRPGLRDRLLEAAAELPTGVLLHVVEGHRPVADQQRIIAAYSAQLRAARPGIGPDELHHLTSRYVAPLAVAPHVAGAAVDLTLVDTDGTQLDLGCPLDATPEQSRGRCYFAAADISREARVHRTLLARALAGAGLVNYPTEWWHWSFGDRYWALTTGAPHALYGPTEARVAA